MAARNRRRRVLLAVTFALVLPGSAARAEGRSPGQPAQAAQAGQRAGTQSARWELAGAFSGSSATATLGDTPYASTTSAEGTARARFFFSPVHDEDAPRSVLPYLQRASSVQVHGAFGGAWTRFEGAFGGAWTRGAFSPSNTLSYGSFGADADVYVTPKLVLFGGMEYEKVGSTSLFVPREFGAAAVGAGLRIGENRLNVGYTHGIAVLGGALQPTRFGALTLSDYALLARRVALSAYGQLLDGGASAGGGLTFYATDDIGLSASGFGGRAIFSAVTPNETYTRVGWGGSVSLWIGRAVRLEPGYRALVLPTRGDPTRSPSTIEHTGSLEVVLRI